MAVNEDLSIQQYRLWGGSLVEPAPDPNHPLVAYRGPFLSPGGYCWIAEVWSFLPGGAHCEPPKDMV